MSVNSVGIGSKRLVRVLTSANFQTPSLDETANETLGRLERVSRHAEPPLRPSKFGVHRRDRFGHSVSVAMKVPPAAAPVGHEIKIAVGRPFRLEHRLVRSTRDLDRVCYGSIREDLAHPGLGCDPRHVRVAPGQPGQAVALWIEPRRRIEVVPRDEDLRRLSAGDVEAHQRIDGLSRAGVVFPDADNPAPPGIDHAVCVAKRARSRLAVRGAGSDRKRRY